MNPRIQLSLSLAGAGLALIGQASLVPQALAGPSLTGNSTQTFTAGSNFNLQYGQSIEVVGNSSSTLNPFQATANALGTNASAVGVLEGNAGTSTLTAAFDRNGFGATTNTGTTLSTPSFAVQAAIIPLGGTGGTGGITTATSSNVFATPTALVLNQTSAAALTVTGAGSNTGIIGATISAQNQGASGITGSFADSLTVINSLSAF